MRSQILVAALLLLFSGHSDGADGDKLLREGDAYFKGGDWDTAMKRYTAAIDVKDSPLLYTKRAASYIRLRMPSAALKDFNRALEMDPTFLLGYMNRGRLQRTTCSFRGAARDFEKVLELQPGHKDATEELAIVEKARVMLVMVEKARVMVEHVESLEASLTSDKGSVASVMAALEPLISSGLVEDCSIALTLRGQAYFYAHDHDLAKRHFGEALKYDPDFKEARDSFNKEARDSFNKEARDTFNKVKAFDRAKKRADTEASQNNWPGAEEAYKDALHIDNMHNRANAELWFGYGNAQHRNGKLSFENVLTLDSAHSQARAMIVQTLQALGQYQDASFENMLTLDSEHSQARAMIVQTLQAPEKYQDASFENVLTLDSEHSQARAMIVRTLQALQKYQDAVNKARDYFQQDQNNHEMRQLLHDAEKQLKMSLRKDYYKILGISKTASDREIKKAYRILAVQYHPDKGTEEDRKASEDKFREVAEAAEVLSDDEKRARYDNGEDVDAPQQQQHPFHRQGQNFHFHQQWGH
eukprot:gene3547-13617_t